MLAGAIGSSVGPTRLFSYSPGSSVTGMGGTFTNSTGNGIRSYVDANGVVQFANTDVIRDGHYIGGVRTTLLEGARTNANTYSQDFSNAAWTKTGGAVLLNATGPDGVTNSAGTFTEDASTGLHALNKAAATFTANTTQSISVFLKAGTRTKARFILDGAVTGQFGVNVDLSNGTLANQTAGAGSSVVSKQIVALGNGWYWIRVSGICDATSTGGIYYLASLDAAGTLSYTGNGTGTLQWFGMMHEVDKTFPSSYIPTTAAAVTRNADVGPYWPWGVLPAAATFYLKTVFQGDLANTDLAIANAASNNPRLLIDGTGSKRRIFTHNGTTSRNSVAAAAPAVGDTVEYRGILASDGSVQFGQTINGGTEAVAAASAALAFAAAWSTPTLLALNSEGGSINVSCNAVIALKNAAGVQSLNTMRGL